MAYLRRLLHRAAIKRQTITVNDQRQRVASYATVDGMGAVPCLMMAGDAAQLIQDFGPDLNCDASVLFPRNTVLYPNPAAPDAKGDRLDITDENGVVSKWLVLKTRDPASARGLIVAAVARASVGG